MKIALISCSKTKKSYPCVAAEMYSPSQLFSLSYEYAKRVADKVFILSSKYGLLEETDPIKPYDLTLKDLPYNRRLDWANYVLGKLKTKCDIAKDEFIILTGKDYYENLLPSLIQTSLPLEHQNLNHRIATLQKWLQKGESIQTQQIESYENIITDKCGELHRIFNSAKRYSPHEIDQVPFENGIYIVFEKGECYSDFDRIVRVGTHRSPGRLKIRLQDHFLNEDKDNSIFRKNIGKALLNRDKSPYLSIWFLDTREEKNKIYINDKVQRDTEKKVSAYLRENMSYVVFPVNNNNQRLRLEEAIISTLNHGTGFSPSKQWLGNYSPEAEIKNSGMWLKQGLDANPLTQDELNYIKAHCPSEESMKIETPPSASFSTPKASLSAPPKSSVSSKVRQYIQMKLEQARSGGASSCVFVSGEIHRALNFKNRMPIVCSVMYQLKKPGDEVLHTTPSGYSSTIKINYHLEEPVI